VLAADRDLPILRQHHEIEMNPQVRETLGELLRRH
jgi:hypothetical protein